MLSIGNIFLNRNEVSTHEAIKRVIFMHETSKYRCSLCSTSLKNRTRMLKSLSINFGKV